MDQLEKNCNGTEQFWLKGLGYYDSGSRSFYTIDKPLEGPNDLMV